MASAIGPKPTAVAPKPSVEINLERHYSSKIYTSGSTISGNVVITAPKELAFDNFEIVFSGIAFTRLDFVQQYPTQSHRPFLKLRMPMEDADFPESRVFEAGKSYTVPFNFVVPHQLPEGSCSHNPAVSDALREQHLRLPPSMGCWDADDQAPDMANVEYAVKARAFKKLEPGQKPTRVAEGSKTIKVLPSLPEDAPLDITTRDERYKLAKSKTLRKGLFSPKTAKLTASSSQPGAAMIAADGHGCSGTGARVHLDYAPESTDSAPPKINSVTAKLQALTFFSAAPADDMPNLGSRGSYSTSHSLSYSTTTTLPSSAVDKVQWTQEAVPLPRRDSGYESSPLDELCGSDSDGAADHSNNFAVRRTSKSKGKSGNNNKPQAPFKYTSTLDVPISIPCSNKKFFLPTFHSCLISRTYTLQLTLSVGPTNTTVTLHLPLQVGVETIYEPQGSSELPSFESVMAMDEDPDAYLRPRVIQVPPPHMQMTSLLPTYGSARQAISVV